MNVEYLGNIHATPRTEGAAYISPHAVIRGAVTIGEDASIWHGAVLRGDMAPIEVGAGSNIQDGAVLHVAEHQPCIIGEDVTVGHGAIVHACRVGDRCLIGMGSIILNGTIVGDECIVGAGTVIPEGKTIPPRSMVLGNPGKITRSLSDEEVAKLREQARMYIDFARETANAESSISGPVPQKKGTA
jgi:carbonic anhydrase/acetyltransferase-like protein (isoleucine patch superfamily)